MAAFGEGAGAGAGAGVRCDTCGKFTRDRHGEYTKGGRARYIVSERDYYSANVPGDPDICYECATAKGYEKK